MWIAENFEECVRKLLPQRFDGRQRQNEIADRSAANHQDLAATGLHSPQYFTNPSAAMNNPKASRKPQPNLIRFSLAVAQSNKSRKRQGEIVSHIPAMT